MINKVHCNYDNFLRSDNLKEPCPSCGRRLYLFFGYRDPSEIKALNWMIGIISVELFIAIIVGILYFVTTQSKL